MEIDQKGPECLICGVPVRYLLRLSPDRAIPICSPCIEAIADAYSAQDAVLEVDDRAYFPYPQAIGNP